MLTEKTYILCILRILETYSDADHILTMKEILSKLKSIYGVEVDRRTVYRNVDLLNEFGYDISDYKDNNVGYYLRERDFEPSELHMLGDAILTAEFIPEKQGKALIQKLQKLGSIYQSKPLGRLACVKTNKKSPNREIFLTVEILDEAIKNKKQVEFNYTTYDLDLMQKPVKELGRGFDLYDYAKNSLFMFGGETQSFTIQCDRKILNDVVDQFGDKLVITSSDEDTFTTVVKETTGGMRLWAIHYFETCRVLSPEWLVDDVCNAIKRGIAKYVLHLVSGTKHNANLVNPCNH